MERPLLPGGRLVEGWLCHQLYRHSGALTKLQFAGGADEVTVSPGLPETTTTYALFRRLYKIAMSADV